MSRQLAFSVTLMFAIAACRDRAGPTVTYRLLQVNGFALPMLASRHAGGQAEIIDGAFTLETDGSYRARLMFRVRSNTVVYLDSAVHVGRYARERDSLIFRAPTGDQINAAGQLFGPVLTFRYPGWTFVYHR